MKRHESLVELSRDHHQALFQAMRLKRADQLDPEQVRTGFLDFWHGHGRRHFRIEEELLLPAYARRGDAGREEVVRVLVDHIVIRRQAEEIETGEAPPIETMRDLGERLDAHVRHEERVLFPLIEDALSEEELAELAARIEAAERGS